MNPKTDATKPVRQGCRVRLISLPDKAKDYPLKLGNIYRVIGFEGDNVITSTDEPGRSAALLRARVERVV